MISTRSFVARKSAVSFMGAGEVTLKFAGALAWALLTTVIGVAPATSPCGTITDREVALAGVTATAVVPKRTETGAGIAWTVAVPDWLAASARPDGPSTRRGCITVKPARELEHPFRGQGGAWTKTMLSPQHAETSSMYDPGVSVRPAAAEPLCALTVNWD